MKLILKTLTAALIMIAFSVNASAQANVTAEASATIITPISIAVNTDMNFGNVAVGAAAGTVVLANDGSRSVTGGVTLPATTGTVSAAVFTVSGEDGFTYTIALPGTITLTSGGNTMDVGAFTSNPSGTGTLTGSSETLNVGATLSVNAGQASGTYTNTTDLIVSVNYN